MNIWLVKLRRWEPLMTEKDQQESVYVAGETMAKAVQAFMDTRLFYGKPIWTMDHVQSAVMLPFPLAAVASAEQTG